jgi:prephenate dehydrogenase
MNEKNQRKKLIDIIKNKKRPPNLCHEIINSNKKELIQQRSTLKKELNECYMNIFSTKDEINTLRAKKKHLYDNNKK